METKDIKEKVDRLEQMLYRATLEEYPKLAREYSYWAEKLAEREKTSSKKRANDDDDDDDDEDDSKVEEVDDDDDVDEDDE